MTAVCTVLSDFCSFRTPLDDTSPILYSIKTSHEPNGCKELDPFASYNTLLLFTTQQNWKYALIMLWSMHISIFFAQFRLASKEFTQNDTIYYPLSHGNMVLPPIGINFFEVIRGCQSTYFFIICGQQP